MCVLEQHNKMFNSQTVKRPTLTKCLRLVLFSALFILDLCVCVLLRCSGDATGTKVAWRALAITVRTRARTTFHPEPLPLIRLDCPGIKIKLNRNFGI